MIITSCSNIEKADLILLNAEVYSMEEDQPWASAMAIKDNKIVAVLENDKSARKYSGPETRVIDLEGKFVLPGFIDGHTHFDGTGAQLNDANLLAVADEAGLIHRGSHPGTGEPSQYMRYGALKGYIGGIMGTHGALFFEPYNDQPDNYGHYRRHTSDDPDYRTGNMDKMYTLIQTGYDAGFVSNVHAIGTKGVSLMLDIYERLMTDLGRDLDGFRVIHAQVIRPEDFPRFKQLNVIAEVNPYHISDDMRWMEERIGHERCKGAYAFRSLLDNGATLSFGSDMPGTSAAEYSAHPRYLLHAAVNRTTLNGEPEGGWFPEEKISMEEALKAYTINNAYAAFEADIRGSLKPGKLADITVCDLNLMEILPTDILKMSIEMTILDGKIVYERPYD